MPFQRNRKQWYQSIWRKRRHTVSRVSTDANMRGFGSIHFPDGYFFASDVAFSSFTYPINPIITISRIKLEVIQTELRKRYTLLYISLSYRLQNEMQGYIRKCLIGKLVQTFQIFHHTALSDGHQIHDWHFSDPIKTIGA